MKICWAYTSVDVPQFIKRPKNRNCVPFILDFYIQEHLDALDGWQPLLGT